MKRKNDKTYSINISHKLDEIIERGTEIKREDILNAEDIKYKRILQGNNNSYDEWGFLDKFKDKEENMK